MKRKIYNDLLIKEIENCFQANKSMSYVLHKELIELYNKYLIVFLVK